MKHAVLLLFSLMIASLSNFSIAQQPVKDSTNRQPRNMVDISQRANIRCITPPAGFDTLTGLNGYYHRQLGASIVISLVQGKTVKEAEYAFNDQHIANIKNTLISKSWVKTDDGRDMLVYQLTYDFQGEKWGRIQAFLGDDQSTLWFVISYPYKYAKDIEGVLLKSLRSAKFDER